MEPWWPCGCPVIGGRPGSTATIWSRRTRHFADTFQSPRPFIWPANSIVDGAAASRGQRPEARQRGLSGVAPCPSLWPCPGGRQSQWHFTLPLTVEVRSRSRSRRRCSRYRPARCTARRNPNRSTPAPPRAARLPANQSPHPYLALFSSVDGPTRRAIARPKQGRTPSTPRRAAVRPGMLLAAGAWQQAVRGICLCEVGVVGGALVAAPEGRTCGQDVDGRCRAWVGLKRQGLATGGPPYERADVRCDEWVLSSDQAFGKDPQAAASDARASFNQTPLHLPLPPPSPPLPLPHLLSTTATPASAAKPRPRHACCRAPQLPAAARRRRGTRRTRASQRFTPQRAPGHHLSTRHRQLVVRRCCSSPSSFVCFGALHKYRSSRLDKPLAATDRTHLPRRSPPVLNDPVSNILLTIRSVTLADPSSATSPISNHGCHLLRRSTDHTHRAAACLIPDNTAHVWRWNTRQPLSHLSSRSVAYSAPLPAAVAPAAAAEAAHVRPGRAQADRETHPTVPAQGQHAAGYGVRQPRLAEQFQRTHAPEPRYGSWATEPDRDRGVE